jgi:hypothetical protein
MAANIVSSCTICKQTFLFPINLHHHLTTSKKGRRCQAVLDHAAGNGNILRLGNAPPILQRIHAQQHDLPPDLLGSFANSTNLRLKIQYNLSTQVFDDFVKSVCDPRYVASTITKCA